MAGVGFTFNATTQQIDFSLPNLNLNTSEVAEDSSRLYFTTIRAQNAVAEALAAGNPYNSGIAFAYDNINNRITAVATGNQVPSITGNAGKYLTTDGTSIVWHNPPIPGGLSIPSFSGNQGKYLTTDGTNLIWANVSINTLSYTTVGNVTYNANLTNTGFTMPVPIKLAPGVDITRDNGAGTFTSVLGGLNSVSADFSPTLGGNLSLGNHNITGTGNINTTGTITASSTIQGGSFTTAGTITTTQGLGADLNVNSHSIIGAGNLNLGAGFISVNGPISAIGGSITADGTLQGSYLTVTQGLGADLALDTYSIKGVGSININGNITSSQQIQGFTVIGNTITATQGLGGDLSLNSHSLNGNGNININGSITTNYLTATEGLGGDLTLNNHNILGSGNVNIVGNLIASSLSVPNLGSNLSLNNYSLTGNGSINIVGSITSSTVHAGDISVDYSLTGNGSINIVGSITSSTVHAGNISITGNEITVSTNNPLYVSNSNQQIVQVRGVTSDGSLANTPQFNLYSSRGTLNSPIANHAGDNVLSLNFGGYNNGGYQQIGSIVCAYDAAATMSNSNPGSGFGIVTNNNNGGFNITTFNSKGVFSVPVIQTGSYAGSGAYPTPAAGMIIFDSNTTHFYGYNGSTWKQLDN